MANEKHIKTLKQGIKFWNKWREDNPQIEPDLIEADLIEAEVRHLPLEKLV
jgi:hypothetical protein